MKLDTYSFTNSFTKEDMHLITFALRRFSTQTKFSDLSEDCLDLIRYIEREMRDKENTEIIEQIAKNRLKK